MVETYIDNPTDFSTYRAHLDEQLNASLMHSHMFVAALAVGRPPRLPLSRLPPSS